MANNLNLGIPVPLDKGGTAAALTDPGADRILFWDDSASIMTWLTAGTGLTITDTTLTASGGTGSALTDAITQSTHGFSVGEVLYLNSSTYTLAQADTAVKAEVVGIVSAVGDANNFTLTTRGRVTGLSGLTAGTFYFLSAGTPGALTATAPSTNGQIRKPLLVADSTTSGYFINYIGTEVGSAGANGTALVNGVSQASHGLAVGDLVRFNGTSFVKGQADTAANAELAGIVSAVADTNNFSYTTDGLVTGLTGLTAGTFYFLSSGTAGLLTATEVTTPGLINKPVLLALSTTSGLFRNYRGNIVPTSGSSGEVAAWVNFNGTGTVAIRESQNVTSITDNNTADYTINFTTAFPTNTYGYALSGPTGNGRSLRLYNGTYTATDAASGQTTTTFRVYYTGTNDDPVDTTPLSAVFFN